MSEVSSVANKSENEENLKSVRSFNDLDFLEIDLTKQAAIIWESRRLILLITACFTFLGLFHYVFAPEEYESQATLIQEIESSGNFDGGSALLRTLAGGNLNLGGSGNLSAAARGRAPLPVNLYPLIVNSTDFQKDLIYHEIEFSTLNRSLTLYDYFTEYYRPPFRQRVYGFVGDMTIYLPFTILRTSRNLLSNALALFQTSDEESAENEASNEDTVHTDMNLDDRLLLITNRERSVIERMRIRIQINIGGGVTEIVTVLPDPKASAMVNALLVERIQDYMTEYRVEKARQNFEDVQQQYENARERYEEAQMRLAEYEDSNINVRSAVFATRQEYLRDQRNLRFNIYNTLAQEVEQARLVMQQEMPVFNILEKPNIPNSPSTGSSDLILVFSVILGFFFGVGWVLTKNFFSKS